MNRLTLSKSVTLKKGETAALLDERGAGVLTGLRLTMKTWTRDTFYKVRLCVRWDDHAAPMLDLPVGCLFGGGGDAVGKDVSLLKMYSAGFSMDGADTPWYFCDLSTPAHAAFADTDFEIPARRTRGKGQQETTWTRHQGSRGV